MSEKKYVGKLNAGTNKFGEPEIRIGYKKEDLEFLLSQVDDRGWVNLYQRVARDGRTYQVFIPYTKPSNENVDVAPAKNNGEIPF